MCMIITVASFKGGVGKSTTAVHIAAFLEREETGSTILIDGDPNRSVTGWSKRGDLPFKVVDERSGLKHVKDFENVVIDTKARPEKSDLVEIAEGCDLLVIPTTPDAMSVETLIEMNEVLHTLGAKYRVLLTIVPPSNQPDGQQARNDLSEVNFPLFEAYIREYKAYKKASLQGVPVYKVKQDAMGRIAWSDYVKLGQEITR